MTDAEHLANCIERTVSGPMWHGPALAELLANVTPEQAATRPVPDAHSIWELVLHITVWARIARRRLKGEALDDPSPSEDWVRAPTPSPGAWTKAVAGMEAAYRELAGDVARLEDSALRGAIPTRGYSAGTMLRGVVEHGTYHGGQIAILKRALGSGLAS